MTCRIRVVERDADSRDVWRNRFHAANCDLPVLCDTAGIAHRPPLERPELAHVASGLRNDDDDLHVVSKPFNINEACEQIPAVDGRGYGFGARHNQDSKRVRHV